MNRPTLIVLIALNGLLAFILAGEWLSQTDKTSSVSKNKTENSEIEQTLPEIDLQERSEDSYSDLVERPMFIKGRKPVEEPVAESTAPVVAKRPDVFNWTLTGIFTAPKGVTAFFTRINNKVEKDNYRKPKLGEELDGWKIAEIHPNSVTLTQSGETKTLQLLKPKPKTVMPTGNTNPPPQRQLHNNGISTQNAPPQPPPLSTQPPVTPQPVTINPNPDDLSVETVNPENP